MDLCLMSVLCYLAGVSGGACGDFSPGFPCNTIDPGGFILQTAATTRQQLPAGTWQSKSAVLRHIIQTRGRSFSLASCNMLKYSYYVYHSKQIQSGRKANTKKDNKVSINAPFFIEQKGLLFSISHYH